MSSPVSPPLEVTDGTTNVIPTKKIVFDAADGFSVTKNGSDARIDFTGGGGTIGGSIASTQVAFGSGSNTIEGESNFVYDKSTDAMKVDKIGVGAVVAASVADNNPVLQVDGSTSSKQAIITVTATTKTLTSSDEMSGQLYVFTSGSAKTLTLPNSCTKGDRLRFTCTGGSGLNVVVAGGATNNGVAAPSSLARNLTNEFYEIVAVADNKYVTGNDTT